MYLLLSYISVYFRKVYLRIMEFTNRAAPTSFQRITNQTAFGRPNWTNWTIREHHVSTRANRELAIRERTGEFWPATRSFPGARCSRWAWSPATSRWDNDTSVILCPPEAPASVGRRIVSQVREVLPVAAGSTADSAKTRSPAAGPVWSSRPSSPFESAK